MAKEAELQSSNAKVEALEWEMVILRQKDSVAKSAKETWKIKKELDDKIKTLSAIQAEVSQLVATNERVKEIVDEVD
ncbi:hypothetical protein V6N11_049919 [Hibiscus sabdariffa]|uniref:Uncharacterized protein n=1 Tax=Hibiscus sabdariffa TaxID=183260 RepID=A0ABR2T8G8_9ROSI